ncbi:MAG: acetyl-CoA C-acetyltransferase [candidate division WOR-3 bacterium]
MRDVVILSAVRTPIGKILGNLAQFKATDLGALVIKEAVKRSGVSPERIEEVIMGQVIQGGSGQNPARQSALKAGLPPTVPAETVNKVCGSGLEAVIQIARAIRVGDIDVGVAGGQESMTNSPHAAFIRSGVKYGSLSLEDLMIKDGLWCAFENTHMGNLAEYTARVAGITRERQDWLAYESHRKAIQAIDNGWFKDEIIPIEVKTKNGTVMVDTDETPRRDTSPEILATLKPAFEKDGTVTAGNAPPLSDGASALVLSSLEFAEKNGLKPLARVLTYASGFTEPKNLFFAPTIAIKKVLEKLGYKHINEFDLIEINEAFAAQVLADHKELQWDWEKFNIHGGAIALGHPIGASGARILTTLIYALRRTGGKRGLAALCLGGGGSVAMAVELVE